MTAAMTPIFTSSFDSPLGPLDIHHDGCSIYALTYATVDSKPIKHQPLPQAWQQMLLDYFAGEFERLNDLPVQLRTGTVFQQAVWWALRDIPAGQTVSYLELARRIGRPNAVRALGQALRRNPLAIILPCHRVIRQGGELGGYAGQSDIGQSRKRFLLWHEGSYPAVQTVAPQEPIRRVRYA